MMVRDQPACCPSVTILDPKLTNNGNNLKSSLLSDASRPET
jgi:hypothetical protein